MDENIPMQIGRIDLGPVEPRRLTQDEQRAMDAALRRSVTIVPDPEMVRLLLQRYTNAALDPKPLHDKHPIEYRVVHRIALPMP